MKNLLRLLLVGAVLGGTSVGLWLWNCEFTPPSLPPDIATNSLDPAIASAINDARARVLKRQSSGAAWGKLGMVLSVHDFIEQADECFREAERLDPQEPRWPYYQAIARIASQPTEAIPKLRRVMALEADAIAPRLRLIRILIDLGEFAEAESLLGEVIRRQPDNAHAQLSLSRLHFERGDLAKSLAELDELVNNQATQKTARSLRLSIYTRQANKEAAQSELSELSRLPNDPPIADAWAGELNRLHVGLRAMLGQINQLLAAGRGDQAAQLLMQAVQQYPKSEEVWLFSGQLLLKTNDLANAERAWRRVLECVPNSVDGHYSLGLTLFRQDRIKESLPQFAKAIQLKPDHGMAHYYIGKCLEDDKQFGQAIEAYRQAIRCQPQNVEALSALSAALNHEGQAAEAQAMRERAQRLRPAN